MKIDKILFYVSAVLFMGAMLLPAIVYDKGVDTGFQILQKGWIGPLAGMFAWYANIFGPLAFIFAAFRKYKTGFVLSVIAFILGLQSLVFDTFPQDEGGVNIGHVSYLSIGFYVWMLSFLLIFIYCFAQTRKQEKVITR